MAKVAAESIIGKIWLIGAGAKSGGSKVQQPIIPIKASYVYKRVALGKPSAYKIGGETAAHNSHKVCPLNVHALIVNI